MRRMLYILAIFVLIVNSGTVFYLLIEAKILLSFSTVLLFLLVVLQGRLSLGFLMRILGAVLFVILLSSMYVLKTGRGDLFLSMQDLRLLLLLSIAISVNKIFEFRRDKFFELLDKILKVLTAHACLSSIVISLFPTQRIIFSLENDASSVYVGYNWLFFQRVNVDYFGWLDPTTFNIGPFLLQRAHGIFWEPGNFAVFANILLFLSLFQTKSRFGLVIAMLGILLSYSTSGLLLGISQVIAYVVLYGLYRSRRNAWKVVFALGPILMLVLFTYTNVIQKFSEGTTSGMSRLLSTLSQARTWMDNPLLGVGHSHELYVQAVNTHIRSSVEALSSLATSTHEDLSFTNSVLTLIAKYGLLSVVFISGLLRNKALRRPGLFGLIILLGCTSAPILYTPFFFYLSAAGLSKN